MSAVQSCTFTQPLLSHSLSHVKYRGGIGPTGVGYYDIISTDQAPAKHGPPPGKIQVVH